MSTTPDPPEALDASTFDIDAWIDDVVRPEITVELYPHEFEFARAVAEIEQQIPAAEKATDRGLDDPTPESLMSRLADLKAERSAKALKVRVRQITDAEIAETSKAAVEAGVTDPRLINLWVISSACVSPTFTPDQLERLRTRDRSGESMVFQLLEAINALAAGLPVPS